MNKEMLHVQVIRQNITQIYLLAAILFQQQVKRILTLPGTLNMAGLLNVLDIAREEKITQSILAFFHCCVWPTKPRQNCPQQTIIEPVTVYGISKYAGEFWCNYYHQRYG